MTFIEETFTASNPLSQKLAMRARLACPGGVSQGFRQFTPFPLTFDRASGSRKTTIDGGDLIDYCMGHGSLIFGHRHPEIEEAAKRQLAKGSHFAAPSVVEIDLAELMIELVPSAELVRFVGTGSEACALGLRLARAATGKTAFIKFEGHYHGWHDEFFVGLAPPYGEPVLSGVPNHAQHCQIVPPGDTAALRQVLETRDDIACIFVEPAGGGHGCIPTSIEWLQDLRELCTKHGIVLIFDEMVSGFRAAPGGFQEVIGITPDLTLLGKALFGGMPSAALVGKKDLMELLSLSSDKALGHNGSWNAFPVACATGLTTLQLLRNGSANAHMNSLGTMLRKSLNAVIDNNNACMHVYGRFSHSHFLFGKRWPFATQDDQVPVGRHSELHRDRESFRLFRLAMFNAGLDFAFGNNISAVHTEADIEETASAFEAGLKMLMRDGVIPENT